jgi:hypothetical protein
MVSRSGIGSAAGRVRRLECKKVLQIWSEFVPVDGRDLARFIFAATTSPFIPGIW